MGRCGEGRAGLKVDGWEEWEWSFGPAREESFKQRVFVIPFGQTDGVGPDWSGRSAVWPELQYRGMRRTSGPDIAPMAARRRVSSSGTERNPCL